MSDQTPAPEAGAEQTEQQTVDTTPFDERFNRLEETFTRQIGELRETFQPPAEDPLGGLDPQLLTALGYDPTEYAQQLQAEQGQPQVDPAAFQTALQQQVAQAVGPLQQQLQSMQLQQLAGQLESQYPELQDPQVAGPVVERTTQLAQSLAQTLGLPESAVGQLRQHPVLIENAYLAHKASTQAVDEASAQPNHAQLENPAGAGPEGSEPSATDRMLAAKRGNSFWGV